MTDKHSGFENRGDVLHDGDHSAGAGRIATPEFDLCGLVTSRICHDLVSPLGAIGNGVELLSMSGLGTTPEVALVLEAIENANARVRFFRIAFGAAPADATIGGGEAIEILRLLFRQTRTRVDWTPQGALSRQEVKLAFLLLQCLDGALPGGGVISVSRAGSRWTLEARGNPLKTEPRLWNRIEALASGGPVAPSEVHFALAPEAARAAGRAISANFANDRAVVSF